MAKKRRTSRKKEPPPDDSPTGNARVHTGEIPWSLDGLGDALKHAGTLHHTPHDDWDRTEKGITVKDDDGSVSRFSLNPDMMTNQIGMYIVGGLRKQGASLEETMSHVWRFLEATAFLAENAARIREEGLIVDDPIDPEATMVAGALVEVLATSRYEGARFQGPDRDPVRSFHIDRVIADAKRRAAEEDDDDA